jgi:hypothetical protein
LYDVKVQVYDLLGHLLFLLYRIGMTSGELFGWVVPEYDIESRGFNESGAADSVNPIYWLSYDDKISIHQHPVC